MREEFKEFCRLYGIDLDDPDQRDNEQRTQTILDFSLEGGLQRVAASIRGSEDVRGFANQASELDWPLAIPFRELAAASRASCSSDPRISTLYKAIEKFLHRRVEAREAKPQKKKQRQIVQGGPGQSSQARHTHIKLFPLGNVVDSSAEDTDEDTDDDASERTVIVVGITIHNVHSSQ